MKYHGTFHDGAYGSMDMFESMEHFDSLDDAKWALRNRFRSGGYDTCRVTVVDFDDDGTYKAGNTVDTLFPCITAEAHFNLYIPGSYDGMVKRVYIGPQGGIRVANG